MGIRTGVVVSALALLTIAGCTDVGAEPHPTVTVQVNTTVTATPSPAPEPSPTQVDNPFARPDWLHTQILDKNDHNGMGDPLPTPPELVNRQLEPRPASLPDPENDRWFVEITPVPQEALERSSWRAECPVSQTDLAYVVMPFWGFDNKPHTGEMLIAKKYAEDVTGVFEYMYENRFPIEEMRITSDEEVNGTHHGDMNITIAFECRRTTGGFQKWSQHAYGTAVDINPFHNPWRRDGYIFPEMATSYLDRTDVRRGMIEYDMKVVKEFEKIGWHWGGRWTALDDWMHFSHNNL